MLLLFRLTPLLESDPRRGCDSDEIFSARLAYAETDQAVHGRINPIDALSVVSARPCRGCHRNGRRRRRRDRGKHVVFTEQSHCDEYGRTERRALLCPDRRQRRIDQADLARYLARSLRHYSVAGANFYWRASGAARIK